MRLGGANFSLFWRPGAAARYQRAVQPMLEQEAEGLKAAIARRFADCGLELHPQKTKIVGGSVSTWMKSLAAWLAPQAAKFPDSSGSIIMVDMGHHCKSNDCRLVWVR